MITIPETEISSRGLHELHRALQQRRQAVDLGKSESTCSPQARILHDVLLELEAAALFGAELLEMEPELAEKFVVIPVARYPFDSAP